MRAGELQGASHRDERRVLAVHDEEEDEGGRGMKRTRMGKKEGR